VSNRTCKRSSKEHALNQRFQVVRLAGRAGQATSRLIMIRTTTRTINYVGRKLFRFLVYIFRFSVYIFRFSVYIFRFPVYIFRFPVYIFRFSVYIFRFPISYFGSAPLFHFCCSVCRPREEINCFSSRLLSSISRVVLLASFRVKLNVKIRSS
jgi:hypothetical protein